jgi:hypothetical protein
MLFKLLILGFTLLSTAIAQDNTDLDSCGVSRIIPFGQMRAPVLK